MTECETCGSIDMDETTWMNKDSEKVPIDRCNFCGHCNGLSTKKGGPHKYLNYQQVHTWVRKYKHKPEVCEICGKDGRLELSNITGKLVKDVHNFQYIHASCHKNYDIKNKIKHEI